MATLTLHQGESKREFVEHPTEVARKALIAAAEVETDDWAAILRRVALALPRRESVTRGGA